MPSISPERLATMFVKVADTLVDDFDLIEFLQNLTHQATQLVSAAAAGVMLADPAGRLEFVAGSDENVTLLELSQLQTQQGPCLDAFRTGSPVVNVDLRAATPRWPWFAPRATAAGYRTVHAFPMRLRAQSIGALNVFGSTAGTGLDHTDVPIVQALADVAAIALLQERAIRHSQDVAEQLQGALTSRVIIEQAKGAVAQARGVTVDEAFTLLRKHARRQNRKLVDVAYTAVTDPAALTRIVR